jgi:hypothetical protein
MISTDIYEQREAQSCGTEETIETETQQWKHLCPCSGMNAMPSKARRRVQDASVVCPWQW